MQARIRQSMNDREAGFTLVELLVVMIIIGVLAAVAIPVFLNQQKKAAETSAESDATSAAIELHALGDDGNVYDMYVSQWTATQIQVSRRDVVSGPVVDSVWIPISAKNSLGVGLRHQ